MADLKNDIDKYLNGELTPQEMHALEKKALSDPFLEDALEGASGFSPDAFAEDMKSIEFSLAARLQKKEGKVVSLWAWPARIAAGLSLIAVATWLVFTLSDNDRTKDLALKEETKSVPAEEKKTTQPGPTTEPIAADAANQPPATESKEREQAAPVLREAKPEVGAASPPSPIVSKPEAEQEQLAEENIAASEPASGAASQPSAEEALKGRVAGVQVTPQEKEAKSEAPAVELAKKSAFKARNSPAPAEAEVADVSPSSGYTDQRKQKTASSGLGAQENSVQRDRNTATDSSAITVMESKLANVQKIKGQVIGDDGVGLPGVNVLIKGTNVGAVTDENGNYQIALQQGREGLVFSYIGYSSKDVEVVDAQTEINVQLNEDASQLSEVVVVGYGTERTGDEDFTSVVEFANPVGGRKAFKQYLEKNLRYPEQALVNNIEGKVTVQFNVETSGELSGFKVIRGIGNGCDEEVIRLIKQGPKWSATKKNTDVVRDRVKVRMRFALPKKKK